MKNGITELLLATAGGITGTFIMTLFMNAMSRITGYNLRVPSILGSLVTMRTKPSGTPSRSFSTMLWGSISHYAIGIVFAFIYLLILKMNSDAYSSLKDALTFGFFAGIVAAIFWFSFIKLHPLSPVINLKLYLVCIFIAHIIFGAGMQLGFKLIGFIAG
ncbi:hypothetical protein F0919_16035 [Taibaiella lutea]|uniref:DUF2938 family protein n=1 Tax=Taibaiella lutea TaxID=2608001 RepID=A0A5M6CBD8_9BACT|nr:hypothetical protein [Taibaiella lutea]KAA5532303.1 hypothetical protein F0919_16035 [Taibaiella lutea]